MSSSRSDVITHSVRPSICNQGFFSKPKEQQWFFKKVQRMFEVQWVFQESFKDASKKFYVCLQKVSWGFLESFQGVSWKIEGCFKVVSSWFQGYLKEV